MGKEERKSTRINHGKICPKEIETIVEQLGKLREIQRDAYISKLIERSDRQKLAFSSLTYLRKLIVHNSKFDDKTKNYYLNIIEQLTHQLQHTLSPMEVRFIFTEIADLKNRLTSRSRYFIRRFWSFLSEMRDSAVSLLRTIFSGKKSK